MPRLSTILLFVLLAGCEREPQHTRGDLTPYLQWTQGTPVIIYLAATKPSGEIVKNARAQGAIIRVTPDAFFIRDALGGTNGYDKNLVLWAEEDTSR